MRLSPRVGRLTYPQRLTDSGEPGKFRALLGSGEHDPEKELFEAAARTGTRLEINGSPRFDLDERLARDAARAGVRLTLASDAHRTEELVYLDYAVGVARRAGLGPEQLANARGLGEWTPR